MPFSVVALNEGLNAILVDRIRLHSGDPGAAGTNNALGSGLSSATFNAAAGGERLLNTNVTVTGLTANQSVTWFSVWLSSGTIFKGRFLISSEDVMANASGEYTLKSGTTKLVAV